MKNRRGSVLIATVLLSVVMMGLITMLYMSVIDHSNNVAVSNNRAKTMSAAEAAVNIAIKQLDISNASASIGIGNWTSTANDANGNGFPDFDEVASTAPLIIDNVEMMTYLRPIPGSQYAIIHASARFAGVVTQMEAIVRIEIIPPDNENPPQWDSEAGILTNGNIDLGGNFDLSGTHGAAFVNGNASITGSVGISTGVKATGTITGNELSEGVYRTEGCDNFLAPIIDMNRLYSRRLEDLDLIFKADGTIYDNTGTLIADMSSGGDYLGYSYAPGGDVVEITEAWTETIPAWNETIPAWTETIPAWTEIITPAWTEIISPAYIRARDKTSDPWLLVTRDSYTPPKYTVISTGATLNNPKYVEEFAAVVTNHPAVTQNHPEEIIDHPETTVNHPETYVYHPAETVYAEMPSWSTSLRDMQSGTYWFEGDLIMKGGGNVTIPELTVFATGNIRATSTPSVTKPATWPYFMVSGMDIWLGGGYDMGTNDDDVLNRGFMMAHGDIVMRGNSSLVGSAYSEMADIQNGIVNGQGLGRGTADVMYNGGLWTGDFMLYNWVPTLGQRIIHLHGVRQTR